MYHLLVGVLMDYIHVTLLDLVMVKDGSSLDNLQIYFQQLVVSGLQILHQMELNQKEIHMLVSMEMKQSYLL